MEREEIGLYIHIPFCRSKCYYCDFNSYAGKDELIPAYFNALKKEVAFYEDKLRNFIIGTVFIGGGTPSSVDAAHISEVVDLCRCRMNISDNAEVSMEANPGTLDYEKLLSYNNAGINRLSMGLQAWQNHILRDIGRIHRSEDFESNLRLARKAGFNNINVDIIFGLPGQTMQEWEETLKRVVGLGVEHFSCYSLKIEEGTVFGDKLDKKEIGYVEDELDREMYYTAVRYLTENGFTHYELSNFAKPGYECRHNLIYWEAKPYIGLGAGAHSYFGNRRFNNSNAIETYINRMDSGSPPSENIEIIEERDRISEFMILGLRLIEGIGKKEFAQRFGTDVSDLYNKQIHKLTGEGLLIFNGERLKLTSKGLDLANKVFIEFI